MDQTQLQDKELTDHSLEHCVFDSEVMDYLLTTLSVELLSKVLRSLPLPPKWTTIRVNSLSCSKVDVMSDLSKLLGDKFVVSEHPKLHDVVLVSGRDTSNLLAYSNLSKVVVDRKCGKAVLRGADVFSPGVKGMPHLQADTKVSVYVDISHKCKRGEKNFCGPIVHIGNGVLKMTRFDIFKKMLKTGVAVEITERKIGVPSLNNVLEDRMFLQNLPSIVTSHVLDPQPGDHVLDMCSAPGGKTTHIAQLLGDRGRVVALERVQNKVEKLKANIAKQNLKCISVFKWDSTQAFSETPSSATSPPFGREVFDRILVDPPCSALGQRPQLINPFKLSEISSYPSYQWCFVADAIKMLKSGGTLVYSTCTLPKQENEMIVARILKSFPEMNLVPAEPIIGQPGIPVDGLTEEDTRRVQRFLPDSTVDSDVDSDTIGFFVSKFSKM